MHDKIDFSQTWSHDSLYGCCKSENFTTELRRPPVGRLPSSVGTLSRELGQRAAEAEVTCSVGAATHVLHAGLDVGFRVNQVGAGAPGL